MSASAAVSVGGEGTYGWSSGQMVLDVQSWLDVPAGNLGWLLKGDESAKSAKRFDSKDNGDSAVRPVLNVVYRP